MFVCQDFVVNHGGGLQGGGDIGMQFGQMRFDHHLCRPYFDEKGRQCVTVNTGQHDEKTGKPKLITMLRNQAEAMGIPVVNGPTSLRKLEWVELDKVVVRAARQRLRAWGDLAAANTYGGFNGMAKSMLEWEAMSDPGYAAVDMDGLTSTRTDAPQYQLQGLPLPITHADFWFPSRQLAMSRNSGTPLDTTMAEAAGRRVAEMIEQITIGTIGGMSYNGGSPFTYGDQPTVYGYLTFPHRITSVTLSAPTSSTLGTTVNDVLNMIYTAANSNFFGPFMLYHSTDWDLYMDQDYFIGTGSAASGTVSTQTLRNRLRAIDQIQDVRRLDYLTASATNSHAYTLIMVQLTPEVARAVNGLDITTVQWETMGGMRVNFKVMCIQVPQFRADYNGNCGIIHAHT